MSENGNRPSNTHDWSHEEKGGDALSDRILLAGIIVLFFLLFFMFSLHDLLRACRDLRSRNGPRHSRRNQLVFYVDQNTNDTSAAATRGLDARVLKSLPVFTFSSKTHPDPTLECVICLSEFEENESGRLLPKCNHIFHLECIDTWFQAHSTCPLCQTLVEETVPVSNNSGDLVLTINEPSRGESGFGFPRENMENT